MRFVMLGTPEECQKRIRTRLMVVEINVVRVVRDKDGQAVGMEVEAWW